jgi:hypothetical protein
MNSAQIRQKIDELESDGTLVFDSVVRNEIRDLNRTGLRSLIRPLIKVAKAGRKKAQKLMRPLFDFEPHGADEMHGAILRKEVSMIFGIDSTNIVLCKVINNNEARKAKYDSFFSEKTVRGISEDFKYTVGLKDQILIFVAQIQGATIRFFYSIARSMEIKPHECLSALFN